VPNSHAAIVDRELFDTVQRILDSKRPVMGQLKHSPKEYILSGLLWCKEHNCLFSGHSNGENCYYTCNERKQLGKKQAPCSWLKKEAIESFILDNLKQKIFTPELIRNGLQAIHIEQAKNKQEDDTEVEDIRKQLAQMKIELDRFYNSIGSGVNPEAVTKPINDRQDRIKQLERRLVEIQRELERGLQLPEITDEMVNIILSKVRAMFDTTDPQELKTALNYFIEKIIIEGKSVTVHYSVAPQATGFVSSNGDPGGLQELMQYRQKGYYPIWSFANNETDTLKRG